MSRPAHTFIVALALTVLAAGFAYALPAALTTAVDDPAVVEVTPTASPTTALPVVYSSPVDESDPVVDEVASDDAADEASASGDHGVAVSTAAHCGVKGKALRDLVVAIAQHVDATVADAQAGCEAALAAADDKEKKNEKSSRSRKTVRTAATDVVDDPPGKGVAKGGGKPSSLDDNPAHSSGRGAGSSATAPGKSGEAPGKSAGASPPRKKTKP